MERGALRAPLAFRLAVIVQRGAQDDAAIDRAGLQLEGVALAVLVRPDSADLVPVGLLAFLADVPGEVGRCGEGLGGGGGFACNDRCSFAWVGLLTPSRSAGGKGSGFMFNTGSWRGPDIEGGAASG